MNDQEKLWISNQSDFDKLAKNAKLKPIFGGSG